MVFAFFFPGPSRLRRPRRAAAAPPPITLARPPRDNPNTQEENRRPGRRIVRTRKEQFR
jgi:hypothetical protein